jgi:AraC-like DNA-binding protein
MFDPQKINAAAFSYYARLERVHRYLCDHPDEPMNLARAASVAGMEKKYFSSFFRQKIGVRFHDWLRHEQIHRAAQLLRSRNRNITRVAMETGFEDLRTFERAFKKHLGLTPRAFRRTARPDCRKIQEN